MLKSYIQNNALETYYKIEEANGYGRWVLACDKNNDSAISIAENIECDQYRSRGNIYEQPKNIIGIYMAIVNNGMDEIDISNMNGFHNLEKYMEHDIVFSDDDRVIVLPSFVLRFYEGMSREV